MKATYTNPPYTGQFIFSLETAFLQVATALAGGEDRLKDIYSAHDPSNPNSEWLELHNISREKALHIFNALSEHKHARFDLK